MSAVGSHGLDSYDVEEEALASVFLCSGIASTRRRALSMARIAKLLVPWVALSAAELAPELGVTPHTVEQLLAELEGAGVVRAVPGKRVLMGRRRKYYVLDRAGLAGALERCRENMDIARVLLGRAFPASWRQARGGRSRAR